jgi:hypothetical protein
MFNRRTVAMAKDTNVWLFSIQPQLRLLRQFPLLVQYVAYGDLPAAPTDHDLPRKSAALILIDIAGHGEDRGNALQRFDHRSIADVSRMYDRGHAGKMFLNRRIVESVRIGNRTDSNGAMFPHGIATG